MDFKYDKNVGKYDFKVMQKNYGLVISYKTEKVSPATVCIYNLKGEQIKKFESYASSGENTIIWNGCSNTNSSVSAGCYMIKLQIEERVFVRKVILAF